MIWAFLILAGMFAVPLVIEQGRKTMDDIARGAAPGQFVQTSLGTTHYLLQGPPRGPVAICVHGLTTPSFVWRGMTRGLALMGFRVLVYDLYGRGFSDRPRGAQDSRFFTDQLNELLEYLEIEDDLTLIGYSMGGAIATAFAAQDPGRIRQLILLAPAGMGVVSSRFGNFIATTPLIGNWLMYALYAHRVRKGVKAEFAATEEVEAVHEGQLAELDYKGFIRSVLASIRGILALAQKDEHQTLHQAGVPVLAIWGSKDTVIPITAIGTLTEWGRNTIQEVVGGAGHGLPYTHTEEVLAILRQHLHES